MTVSNPYVWGLGRRKTAVARVRLKPGTGRFQVNGKPLNEYFTTLRDLEKARAPLALLESADIYDILVKVEGGPWNSGRASWRCRPGIAGSHPP